MPRITYREHNGTEHVIEAANGTSVMQAAIDNSVPGIDADCGGQCACATCHVYVAEQWRETVGTPPQAEEAMLEMNPERRASSRLACQILVTDAIDGVVVTLPEFQF